jgi:hypothetical protein
MNHTMLLRRIALLGLALSGGSAQAAAWGVNDTVDTPVGQACPGFTNCSLREALTSAEANPGSDAILVSAGTYPLTNGVLTVTQTLDISRVGAGASIIDGGGATRIFDITAGTFSLRFMTVRGGRAGGNPAEGGAIRGAAGTTIRIESTALTANVAESTVAARGGAIASQGSVTIDTASGSQTGASLNGNTARIVSGGVGAAQGGAIWIGPSGSLTIGARSVLDANLAEAVDTASTAMGGAVFSASGVSLTQATVSGNTAHGGDIAQGGGIAAATTTTLVRSTVSGNAATAESGDAEGGGLWNGAGGDVQADFSTVAGNTVQARGAGDARGGGVFAPAITLSNSTVTANSVAATGSGDARGGGIAGSDTFDTLGSIVSGNTQGSGDDCFGGELASLGYTLLAPTTDCTYTPGTGDIVTSTPNLQPLANNGGLTRTVAVFPGSAAYNAIPAAEPDCAGSPTDQRGSARPSHGLCEIGAFEGQFASDVRVTLTDSLNSLLSGASTTYTLTVFHNGEVPFSGATLVTPAASGLLKTNVSCVLPAGCTAPSVSELEAGFTLPTLSSGQVYRLTIATDVTAESGMVTQTATVAMPAGVTDTMPGNDTASDVNEVLPIGVFADGFE